MDQRAAARIIDGKASAARLRARITAEVARLRDELGLVPGLAVVLVGRDPASEVYVRAKHRKTLEAGMNSFEHRLPATTTEAELFRLIHRLNADPAVHGILVQLPLPAALDETRVLAAIDPAKDVDGFHAFNAGLLATGQHGIVPCTPLGCLRLLRETLGDLTGCEAVVLGRSNIVGKPMGQLLLAANCTVTIAHSRTLDLPDVVRRADVVVAAVGRPQMVRGNWIRAGATVIDVGINRVPAPERGVEATRLVGDVNFTEAIEVAGAITPVPGGVGPMTIACLLANTLTACGRQHRVSGLGDLLRP